MPFPNFANKHACDSFFTPQEIIEYWRKRGIAPQFTVPQGVILCYQRDLFEYIESTEKLEHIKVPMVDMYILSETESRLAVCANFGIGAPVAAMVLEGMIALGTRNFLSIGTAGGLHKNLSVGDIVLCTGAVRDEGVSHHYLESTTYAYPSSALSVRFKETLQRLQIPFSEGTTWTIDALFRETVEEARHYQQQGVYTVEMEAAALCAVAEYRQVELATAFTISDSLADLEWNPLFHSERLREGMINLYRAARATLLMQTA
jgi:uridine phosphorylase